MLKKKKTELSKLLETEFTAEKEAEISQELKAVCKKQYTSVVSCVDLYEKYADSHFETLLPHMKQEQIKAKSNQVRADLRFEMNELEQTELRLRQVQQIYNDEREKLRQVKEEAEKDAPLNDSSRERFALLPSNAGDLEDEIIKLVSQINLLIVADPNVVQEHNEILKSIDDLELRVRKEEQSFSLHEGGRLKLHDKWLNPLENIVKQLNSKFTRLFADLGFVGEVRLRKDDDYSKYAIEIWVKFRADVKQI